MHGIRDAFSRVLNQVIPLQTVDTIIRINFILIDIELDAACRWDYIQFTSPGESPDKHCGDDLPSILRFDSLAHGLILLYNQISYRGPLLTEFIADGSQGRFSLLVTYMGLTIFIIYLQRLNMVNLVHITH